MTYAPVGQQIDVVEAQDEVVLVLGGAGTGKTTTAAAAVRAHLDRLEGLDTDSARPARALFLSFSRASVAQIIERAADVLGPHRAQVEITTFHAFAWRLLRRWGGAIDLPDPILLSESEAKLFSAPGTLRYRDMLPRALEVCEVPAVLRHVRARWSIIVSDEFQDTDDDQFALLQKVRGSARLLLLGDPNQCIYEGLPGVAGVGPRRIELAKAALGARQIDLPDVSFRDPSNILPAAAAAIRRREFKHEAVSTALAEGRIEVRTGLVSEHEADTVAAVTAGLREQGHTVGVFSHHVDATTQLSDELVRRGVAHEVVGLSECLGAALDAQHAMVQFAGGRIGWQDVRGRLAVFITSSVRGNAVPELAQMALGRRPAPDAFDSRLGDLETTLTGTAPLAAVEVALDAHRALGLSRGATNWEQAGRLLRSAARASFGRLSDRQSGPSPLEGLEARVRGRRDSLLTATSGEDVAEVQLMGLYQTKGREADATVVVLRATDFFGRESEPFRVGSRLLYVVLTRARHKTVLVAVGSPLPPLIAPLARLHSATA
jgi:DNA helicase-2/ATP-dependent DNA helicase PcrA